MTTTYKWMEEFPNKETDAKSDPLYTMGTTDKRRR